jgi:HSP20 family protein
MTTLVRWNPWRDFGSLTRNFDQLFDTLAPGSTRGPNGEETDFLGTWYPAVDIFDNDNEIILKAELPGLKKEDIDIHVEDNLLTLRGERKREEEVKEKGFFRSERAYGAFSRSFTLPATVAVKKISADYKDGILAVTLPKAEEAKPRQIEVKVA